MAIRDGKFIRGIAGDVTFRELNGKQLIQGKTKKAQIDMTPATYDAAYVFGRASTLARYIRDNNHSIIRFYDSLMISRFTGECNQIVQQATTTQEGVFDYSQDNFNRLNGFEFNSSSPVKNYLFAQPLVTLTEQTLTVDLPEMQIPKELKFPANAQYCTLAFCVTLYDLNNDQYSRDEIKVVEIELKHPTSTHPPQQLVFESAPGCLCVIALALYYSEKTFAGKAVINNKQLSPAAILKAEICSGEATADKKWHKMSFNAKRKRKKIKKKAKKESDDQTT